MADDTINVSVGGDFNPLLKQADVAYGRVQSKWNSKPLQLRLDTSKFPLGKITNDARAFDQAIGAATTRVTAFAAAAGVFLTIRRSFELLVHSTIEVESALAKIGVNLNTSAAGLKQFGAQVFNIARDTGQTFETAAKAAQELSKQGLGTVETANRLKAALTLTRYAGIDAGEAVKDLTVTINTFKGEALTAGGVVDKFTAISRRFANVSANDLTGAIERVGETAQQSGVSLNQLLSYITAIQRETGRGGSAIGTGLNSIFNRLNEPKYADKLQEQGISTRSKNGELLAVPTILQNIANKYGSLNKIQQENILVDIAQSRQVGILRSLLEDLGSASGTANAAIKTLSNTTGEGDRVNEAYNKTLQSRLQSTETSFKQLFSAIGESGPSTLFKGLVDGIDSVRQAFSGDTATSLGRDLGDGIVKGLGAVLTGPGLVVALSLVAKATAVIISKIGEEGASLLSINGIAEARVAVQKNLNDLLFRATEAERAQYDAATTLLGKKEAILAISTRIAEVDAASALSTARLIDSFVSVGALGGARIEPRLGRNAAGGYNPAIGREIAAIAGGVGGASASARPVAIGNFAFGGGVTGPIVANSDEYLVKNYANGGSAIFNPDMVRRHGLPAGATKVGSAAGGYIPNAASGGFQFQDLRLQAGTVGQHGGGFFVQPSQIDELNGLFENIRKVGSTNAAAKYGEQIQALNATFDKASQKQVFKKLGEEFNALYEKAKIVTDGTRKANPEAFESTRLKTTLAEIVAQNESLHRNAAAREASFEDFNRGPLSNINEAFRGQSPFDPERVASTQSPFQKFRGRLNNPGTQLGLSIGASFAAGFIKDGESGTAGGIERGAAQGALQGGGVGLQLGGPYGALAGVAIGGLVGALTKASKSVSEFSDSLGNASNRDASTALYAFAQDEGKAPSNIAAAGRGIKAGSLSSADFNELRDAALGNVRVDKARALLDKDTNAVGLGTIDVGDRQLGATLKGLLFAYRSAERDAVKLAEETKRAAASAAEIAAKAGLQANAASARSPGAENDLTRAGGANTLLSPTARNAARLAGFKALISQNPESEKDIVETSGYKRALAVSQQDTALADSVAFIRGHRGLGGYRATNERGEFISGIDSNGKTTGGGILGTIQRLARDNPDDRDTANALIKRIQQGSNGVINAGGPGGGPAIFNGNGYPGGTKIETYTNQEKLTQAVLASQTSFEKNAAAIQKTNGDFTQALAIAAAQFKEGAAIFKSAQPNVSFNLSVSANNLPAVQEIFEDTQRRLAKLEGTAPPPPKAKPTASSRGGGGHAAVN